MAIADVTARSLEPGEWARGDVSGQNRMKAQALAVLAKLQTKAYHAKVGDEAWQYILEAFRLVADIEIEP